MRLVHSKHHDGRAADWGSAQDDRPCPAKMAAPFLPAQIKQPCSLAGFWVNTRKVRPLVVIVCVACQRQIQGRCHTAVLHRNDVVDFESDRHKLLRQATILAAMPRALSDELRQALVDRHHDAARWCFNATRA